MMQLLLYITSQIITVAILLLSRVEATKQGYRILGCSEGWIPRDFNPATASYQISTEEDRSRWMRRIPDTTPLSAMSIPGTHNSLEWSLEIPRRGRCQNVDLWRQLSDGGVRYFDIPLRMCDGNLWGPGYGVLGEPIHGPGWCSNITFYSGGKAMRLTKNDEFNKSILYRFTSFLNRHRTEAIIIKFRIDPREPDNEEYRKEFRGMFWKHHYDVFNKNFPHYFFHTTHGRNFDKAPTMDQMRGKILLITDFGDIPGVENITDPGRGRAIRWNSDTIHAGRDWPVKKLSDIDEKWRYVNKHLDSVYKTIPWIANEAHQKGGEDGIFYITHASGGNQSGPVTPEMVAAGAERVLLGAGVGREPLPQKYSFFTRIKKLFGIKPKPKQRVRDQKGDPKAEGTTLSVYGRRHRVEGTKGVEGMNVRLLRRLRAEKKAGGFRRTGIIVTNFPSFNITSAIIDLNYVV